MVSSEDLAWLFSLSSTDFAVQAGELIAEVFDDTDVEQQEIVWSHRRDPIIASTVGRWFDAVELDSPEAARQRERYQWSLVPEAKWDGAAQHLEALREAWASCRCGDPNGFFVLCRELMVDPENGALTFHDDLTAWPSYNVLALDESVLEEAAERYLLREPPGDDAWFNTTSSIPYWAFFGYVALAFLARRPGGIESLSLLPVRFWDRWMPVVVWSTDGFGDLESHTKICSAACQRAPRTYLRWRLQQVQQRAQTQQLGGTLPLSTTTALVPSLKPCLEMSWMFWRAPLRTLKFRR